MQEASPKYPPEIGRPTVRSYFEIQNRPPIEYAGTIAGFDPDLRYSREALNQQLTAPDVSLKMGLRAVDTFYFAAKSAILNTADSVTVRKARTDRRAMHAVLEWTAWARSVTFPEDIARRIDTRSAELFGRIADDRPDLTDIKGFWETAFGAVLDGFASNGRDRAFNLMTLTRNASNEILDMVLSPPAPDRASILRDMVVEDTQPDDAVLYSRPFIRLVRHIPTGEPETAQSIFLWAAHAHRVAASIGESGDIDAFADMNLPAIVAIAKRQWDALTADQQREFMSIDVFSAMFSMYPDVMTSRAGTSLTTAVSDASGIYDMVISITAAASPESKHHIKTWLTHIMRRHPDFELRAISVWFPDMARNLEAARPKSLLKAAATVFERT